MIMRLLATACLMLIAAACAARNPRLPASGDRVRVWTMPGVPSEEPVAVVGEVVAVSPDTLTLRSKDRPLESLPWPAIAALEIDAARGRTALRIVTCTMLPVGVVAAVTDLAGEERNSERGFFYGLYTLLFFDGCFFPGPDWRTALVPSRE